MSLRCIIVEDQPPAQRILQKFIDDAGILQLCGTFSDGISAIEFLKTSTIDLMFLDIHLPKINGLEFLKSLESPPQVILTTAFSEYAIKGYDLNVVDYLLKPFSFQRFLQAINKVNVIKPVTDVSILEEERKEIYVKSGHDFLRLRVSDIIFIHSDSDYTEIQLTDKKVLSNESLKHWVKKLGEVRFMQLHKSYVINMSKIEKVSGNQVYMEGASTVPIGRAFKEQFMNRLIYPISKR